MQENLRRIYLHDESIIAHVWVFSGYLLISIMQNFRKICLHEESIIAHVWVSNGYRLSSIMQENFSLSLQYMTFIAVNSKIISLEWACDRNMEELGEHVKSSLHK